ncbi:MAG: VPLPA-CTERM-specific exosortase XrtD [Alphaproteobacteria bacterium]
MTFKSNNHIVFFTVLASAVSVFFAISFESLSNLPTYWNKDEYSHGYIIPLIAAYLAWHELSRKDYSLESSWSGILCLFLSLSIAIFAKLSSSEAFLNYSFIIGLLGVSYAFFGLKITKAILPALLFLFYAAPLPHILYGNISIQMQLISSFLGTSLIQLAGHSVFQEGNIIDLGHMKLHVVEACNGLRYLFPLMSLGYITAYLLDAKLWKRLVLMVSVIPITIVMNALRIAAIGISVNVWGQEMAEGVIHILEGVVVFALCLLFLAIEVWLILKLSRNDRFKYEYLSFPSKLKVSKIVRIRPPAQVFGLLLCMGGIVIFSLSHVTRSEFVNTASNLKSFPLYISEWSGQQDFLSPQEILTLDLTDYWMANYKLDNTLESPVNFYIAYYNSQKMRANIHIPLNCILASGWSLDSEVSMIVNTEQGDIPVKRLLIRKGNQAGLVYYWLEQRGRRLSNPIEAKFYLMWDSIMLNRTDGALVRVSSSISPFENPEAVDKKIHKFIQDVYPQVETFIPGK